MTHGSVRYTLYMSLSDGGEFLVDYSVNVFNW